MSVNAADLNTSAEEDDAQALQSKELLFDDKSQTRVQEEITSIKQIVVQPEADDDNETLKGETDESIFIKQKITFSEGEVKAETTSKSANDDISQSNDAEDKTEISPIIKVVIWPNSVSELNETEESDTKLRFAWTIDEKFIDQEHSRDKEVQYMLDNLLEINSSTKNSIEIEEWNGKFEPATYTKSYAKLHEFVRNSSDIHKHELFSTLFPILISICNEMESNGFSCEAKHFVEAYEIDFAYFYEQSYKNLLRASEPSLPVKLADYCVIRISNEAYELFDARIQKFPELAKLVNKNLIFEKYKAATRIGTVSGSHITEATGRNADAIMLYGYHKETYLDSRHTTDSPIGDPDYVDEQSTSTQQVTPGLEFTGSGKRCKLNYSIPPLDRVPIPPLRYNEKKTRFQEWGSFSKRIKLDAKTLPSVCFYTLLNTKQTVTCVEFSEDSSMLACGFKNSTIRIWALTPNKLRSIKQAEQLKKLDVELADIYARMLDDISGQDARTMCGHCGPVYRCAFSMDLVQLLSCSEDTTIRLWSLYTWHCLVVYRCHQLPVWDVRFSPTGHYFVSGSKDQTAMLWTTNSPRPLRIFTGHLSDVDSVQFHPNANYIATGSSDCTIRIFDVFDAKTLQLFVGHKAAVHSLAFSRCGRFLTSAGIDNLLIIWDLEYGSKVKVLKFHHAPVHSLDFCRNGILLAVGGLDCRLSFWQFSNIIDDYLKLPCSNKASDEEALKSFKANYLLCTFPSKRTPFLAVHFTRTNLVLAAGAFES